MTMEERDFWTAANSGDAAVGGRSDAEAPRAQREPRIDTPALNIYLGSTPALAGLWLDQYELRDLLPQDRRRVASLYLDIDAPPPELTELATWRQGSDGWTRVEIKHIEVPLDIEYGAQSPEQVRHLLIEPHLPRSYTHGAGGIRNNGHVAMCANVDEVSTRIEHLLSALVSYSGERTERRARDILVNIVAFLGGGTGSGTLPDMALLVRNILRRNGYPARLFIYCLLPEHIGSATPQEISWRRSNAVATLQELMALSLLGHTTPGYQKLLGSMPLEVEAEPVANEIFLMGRTEMSSPAQVAQIAAMDMQMRICDRSGVGRHERSLQSDLQCLVQRDDRNLYTMFGTTCPMEVVLPARELAEPFAYRSARTLIRDMTGNGRATGGPASRQGSGARGEDAVSGIRAELRQRYLKRAEPWRDALRPEVQRLPAGPFERARTQRALDVLWEAMEERVERASADIGEERKLLEAAEEQAIDATVPPTGIGGAGPLALWRMLLEERLRVYQAALREETDGARGLPARDTRLESELLSARLPMTQAGKARAVHEAYNRQLATRVEAARRRETMDLLRQLIDRVENRLNLLQTFIPELGSQAVQDYLTSRERSYPELSGRLSRAHPHRANVFDLDELRINGQSWPTERLYEYLHGTAALDEDSTGRNPHIGRFLAWVARKHGTMALSPRQSGQQFAERVVEYFRDEVYLPALQEMTLLDVIARCCVQPGDRTGQRAIETVIATHLRRMKEHVQPLIKHNPSVWEGGQQQLRVTASVGISMKGHERDLLEGIINRLGAVGESGQAVRPTLQDAIDPHRMQLLYAQHGLSLTSMVDFYAEENSAMADFQYHHSRWFGNGQPGSYGQGGLPVFTSSEAERLVLHPQALGDPRGRPLHKRIVREPFAWRPEAAGVARSADGVRSMSRMGGMGGANSNGVGARAGQGADPGRGFPGNE
jgi:Tubulin like